MSVAQPPSVSTEGSPVGMPEQIAAGVGVVGGGAQGQQVVSDVVGEEEHSFNEEPNYNRIGESRSHLDDNDFALYDEDDDMPGSDSTGRWTPTNDFGGVGINNAKQRQWKLSEEELRQVKEQCKKVFNTEHPTRNDVVNYFFGDASPLWQVFRDRLNWTHKQFLLFMATNQRMSTCRCSSAELYNPSSPLDTSDILSKEEYTTCWKEICEVGRPSTTSAGANSEELFWEEVESALNKMLRRVTIVGRDGKQIYLFDDDKMHFESHARNHREWNVKTTKHTRDNRWGFILDTLCIPALLMPCNVHTHRRGEKQVDVTRQQLFGSAFGNNPLQVVDLSDTELHCDRGFSGEGNHQDVLAPSGAGITVTTQRALWAAYNYSQTPKANDKRTYIDPNGIMALYVSEKTVHGRKLACGAFVTGTGKVVLYMSSVHKSTKLDYVTSDKWGKLHKNNRDKLKELGFGLEQSLHHVKSAEAKRIHAQYYQQFKNIPIDQVTAFAGGKEFHIGRRLSMSSKQMYDFILVCKRHFLDLEHDFIQDIFKFMYKNYDAEKRQEEKDRAEAAAASQASGEGAEDPITYESTKGIEELIIDGPEEGNVEETVRLDIHKFNENMFDNCRESELVDILDNADGPYLDEFLRQIRGGTASSATAKKNRCKKWAKAPDDQRRYVLMKKDKLREEYTRKHGKPFAASWTPATLIKEILKDAEPQEEASFEQDMMDTIVGSGVLTQLSGDAAENCTKGQEMEPVFAAEIMKKAKAGEFGFGGKLEEVVTVGTVQKTDERYVKTSVDRLIGVNMGDDENPQREILLLELKSRLKPATEQPEQDRIEKLRRKGLLDEDDESKIYHEMSSDHQHAYTFSKTSCIHAVGNSKSVLSICKMDFPETLLASYKRTVKFIHDSGLNIFYRDGEDDEIQANEEEMKRIEKAVEKHKDTYKDMYRFKYNVNLWKDLTAGPKLPLPPLLYLIPVALAWWNINKPIGDMITQMLWDMMYYTPVSNPQAVLVKRLAHQLPTYMCHRLFQLFNTSRDLSSFHSILQYRDTTRKGLSFFNSTVAVDALLVSMAKRYNPAQELPPPPAGAPLVVNQAVAGTFSMAGAFPVTNNTPPRNRKAWYEDPSNACHYVFQRRHSCIGGCVHIACNENRVQVNGADKTCAECGRTGATWWCPQCHVFLHGLKPSARSLGPGEETTLMAAASHMRKRNSEGELINHYTQMSCVDKWHLQARTRAFSGINSTSIVTVSVSQFDSSRHNVSTNLSFSDATMNTTDDEATSTEIEDNNNNDNDSNS